MKASTERIVALFFVMFMVGNFVLPNESSASHVVEQCKGERWRTCYAEELARLVQTQEFPNVIKLLHEIQEIDPTARDCHLIAHLMGAAEMEKNPAAWRDTLEKMSAGECVGGFIHGVIEAAALRETALKFDENTIPEICALSSKNGGESYCFHIMGHLLLTQELGNIPKSVDTCLKLPGKTSYNCSTGVFMENITRTNLSEHDIAKPLPYNEESARYQEGICRQYEGETTRACWQEITHLYAHIAKHNPARLYELCGGATTLEGRDSCFLHGVTFIPGQPTVTPEQLDAVSLCSPFSQGFSDEKRRFSRCVSTITYVLLSSSEKFGDRVKKICESTPRRYEEACSQAFQRGIISRPLLEAD